MPWGGAQRLDLKLRQEKLSHQSGPDARGLLTPNPLLFTEVSVETVRE